MRDGIEVLVLQHYHAVFIILVAHLKKSILIMIMRIIQEQLIGEMVMVLRLLAPIGKSIGMKVELKVAHQVLHYLMIIKGLLDNYLVDLVLVEQVVIVMENYIGLFLHLI